MTKLPTTIDLPADIYRRVQQAAQKWRRSVAEVVAQVLAAHLPPADDELPAEVEEALKSLESLDDDALWEVMVSSLPAVKQRRLDRLLDKNSAGTLTPKERAALDARHREANLLMLKKAHAAVLLKQRGVQIPTAEELGQYQRHRKP